MTTPARLVEPGHGHDQPVPFVDLRRQIDQLRPEIDLAVAQVLDSGRFILDEQVAGLEAEFARGLDVALAVAVGSGTDALRLALLAAGVEPGDEVITTPLTAIATLVAIESSGARPVLVDIDAGTYTLDPSAVAAALSPRVKAIVPVHLYGHPADLDPLLALADREGLALVEDACQAHGALYRGRAAGTIGAFGCFSFYPTKNLGAYGDGGMIVTNSAAAAERLRLLRNYGERARFEHHLRGFNSRLDEMQAAILRAKLRHLETWNRRRRAIARSYSRRLSSSVGVPRENPDATHVYCSYVIRHPERDQLRQWLSRSGIQTSIQYPLPVHWQPAYGDLGRGREFPVAERATREILSLPVFPELHDEEVERVCEAIIAFGR